jgi:hypothetical protein
VSVGSLTIAGYRAFAPQPSATMAELKELKADDLERLLAERRTVDAAMAEKKCLAEEARARAERPDPFTERDEHEEARHG